MKPRRATLRTLMALVALIAIDCATVRLAAARPDHRLGIWFGLVPVFLVLNLIAFVRLGKGPYSPQRAWFLRGFVLTALAATAWLAAPLLLDPDRAKILVQDLGLMLSHYVSQPVGLVTGPGNVVGIALMILFSFLVFGVVISGPILVLALLGGWLTQTAGQTMTRGTNQAPRQETLEPRGHS